MRTKHIQIHCTDSKGRKYIVNRFTAENNESVTPVKQRDLYDKALRMAGSWATVYPDDRFQVVTVPPGR